MEKEQGIQQPLEVIGKLLRQTTHTGIPLMHSSELKVIKEGIEQWQGERGKRVDSAEPEISK